MKNPVALLLAVLGLTAAACNNDDGLPYDLWIDSDFKAVEMVQVLDAVDEWNDVTETNGLGRAFNVVGAYDDDHDAGDWSDGISVVYKATHREAGISEDDHVISGLGSDGGDVLIFTETIRGYMSPENYPAAVRSIALHELGHVLGLVHSEDTADVMAPNPGSHHLTEGDIAQLCLVNGC